jgi:hypothetical protein
METDIFHTPYGEAIVTERGLFQNPLTGITYIEYDCSVVNSDGITTTGTIAVEPGEKLTQQLVDSAASCATTKGRTANRAKIEEIRQFIRELKGLPSPDSDQ